MSHIFKEIKETNMKHTCDIDITCYSMLHLFELTVNYLI